MARAAGKRVRTRTRRLSIPKQEKMANSRIATILLTSRDPRPMTVVKTAIAVGKEILENVKMAASFGDSACWAVVRYSEPIWRQYAVPTAMRKIGTIIVSIDRATLVNPISPKVQTRESITQVSGKRMQAKLRKRTKRITAISKKVIGGSRKKSFSVYVASA